MGLSSNVSFNIYHSLLYSLSYNLHEKYDICNNKHLIILPIKVITLKFSWISYKLIYLLRKEGITYSLRHIPQKNMWSNEKPITNLTICIKVWFLIFFTPFWNGVLGAHNWDIITCSLWKQSNLLDTLPRSNQSVWYVYPIGYLIPH